MRALKDVDEALDSIGGFETYQRRVLICILFLFSMGSYALYPMAFYELKPDYECRPVGGAADDWVSCKPKDFCKDNKIKGSMEVKPNFEKADSFPSWVTRYGMECADKAAFGYFGSLFFFGVVLGAATLPRVSDTFGRRPLVLFGASLHLICGILVLLSTSRILTYVLYFMMGFAMIGRAIIGYIWMSDHMMEKDIAKATSILFGIDSLAIAVVSLYFLNSPGSGHWMYPFGLPLIGLFCIIILICTMTDGPKFYYGIGEYDKCREVLTRMGRLNGYLDDHEKFEDKFVVELEQEAG